MNPNFARMRGFNLVEVMVALLVMALGLAGIASLLLNGVATTNGANLNSLAVTHVQTGVEMMRANMGAYTDGWYAGAQTTGAVPAPVNCIGSGGCSTEQQASNDFTTWRARLAESMPGGTGFICMDSTPDDGQPGALACDGAGHNVIKIFWIDGHDEEMRTAGDTHHLFAAAVTP